MYQINHLPTEYDHLVHIFLQHFDYISFQFAIIWLHCLLIYLLNLIEKKYICLSLQNAKNKTQDVIIILII